MNTPGKASLPVIKRLPKYYRYLRTLKNDGITSISVSYTHLTLPTIYSV
mgnify:CR=1 FL=1